MTRRIVILPLSAALLFGCAETERAPTPTPSPRPESPSWEYSHPLAEQRLVSFAGSLCPEESVDFTNTDGATTVNVTSEVAGQAQCRIDIEVTIPAGYRFRRTKFHTGGYAYNELTSPRDSTVTIHYSMSGERLSSEHVVSSREPDQPVDGTYLLVDTPDFREPECENHEEPSVLDLSIELEVDIPEGNFLSVSAIDYDLDSAQWVGCDEAF